MLDKTKRYLVVGLGLLGGKYALELTKAGFHVDGINRSEGHLQYALDHGYIASGKTHDFEDLVQQADYIIFGLYPTALLEWFKAYGPLLKPGCIFTDVSGVKTGLVEPVQALCPAGVEFIASHPMAGRETSSVEHAAEVNFAPANFIITPTDKNTPEAIQWAKELAEVLLPVLDLQLGGQDVPSIILIARFAFAGKPSVLPNRLSDRAGWLPAGAARAVRSRSGNTVPATALPVHAAAAPD